MKRQNFSLGGFSFLLLLVLGCTFLCFPQRVAAGCSEGLLRCARTLIPALFPFLVIARCAGVELRLLQALGGPLCRLLGLPKAAASGLVMGLLGGFAPAGACLAESYKARRIDAEGASAALCWMGAGPSFVIMAGGWAVMGSSKTGLLLWLCQLAASALCTRLVCCIKKGAISSQPLQPAAASGSFTAAVNRATEDMLHICGCVLLFCMIQAVFFPAGGAVCALLELSAGAAAAAQQKSTVLLIFSLSSLGLCGILQLRSILPAEISLSPFLLTRPLHFGFFLLFYRTALLLFPSAVPVFAGGQRLSLGLRCPVPGTVFLFLFLFSCCSCIWRQLSLRAATKRV